MGDGSSRCKSGRRAVPVLGIALLFLLAFEVGPAGADLWPLAWQLGGQRNYLGPFVSAEGEGETTSVIARPFFSYDAAEGGTTRSFFPLGKSTPEFSYFFPKP